MIELMVPNPSLLLSLLPYEVEPFSLVYAFEARRQTQMFYCACTFHVVVTAKPRQISCCLPSEKLV